MRALGKEIVPNTACAVNTEFTARLLTNPAATTTTKWGDTAGTFDAAAWSPPDGEVHVTDAFARLTRFQNLPSASPNESCDLEPQTADGVINIADISMTLSAFTSRPYPFEGPCQ